MGCHLSTEQIFDRYLNSDPKKYDTIRFQVFCKHFSIPQYFNSIVQSTSPLIKFPGQWPRFQSAGVNLAYISFGVF